VSGHRLFERLALAASLLGGLAGAQRLAAQAQPTAPTASAVTIVLPPKVVAGKPATLAVLGADGRVTYGATVILSQSQQVTTDWTGRASFTVPDSAAYLVAQASGVTAAALVDTPLSGPPPQSVDIPPVVSVHDGFTICGAGLRGDADAYVVKINGKPALVLAASPECIVVLPGREAAPGAATVSVEAPGAQWSGTTTLVAFDFVPPNPPLLPDAKGSLTVRVQGTQQKLAVAVENETPGVLKFLRGDVLRMVTSGGAQNSAQVKVQGVRSGEFSFHARLLPKPRVETARRYLEAAQTIAPKELWDDIRRLTDQLKHHQRDSEKVRSELGRIEANGASGDFRALIDAARDAL